MRDGQAVGRWARAWEWLRIAVLGAAVVALIAIGWHDAAKLLRWQPLGIDFMPMWAAAHVAHIHPHWIYDFGRLTRFQQPLLVGYPFRGLRPFVYPPAALLVFAPFGQAPFVAANQAWTAAGLIAIVAAVAGQLKSQRFLALLVMVLSPASLLVLVTGQVTFLIAAMGVAGLLCLKTRPIVAGVLFGVAGVIKPQALVLLPVALVALGAWRTIAATAFAAALMAGLSAVLFGLHAWFDWLSAVSRFGAMVMTSPGLVRGMITPTALGMTMGLDPGATDVWRIGFGIGALVMVWSVFRKTDDLARRLTALYGGAIFITPYAMHYDAALLAPAMALMLSGRTQPGAWIAALAASALLCCAAIPHWGAAAVTAFILAVALTREPAFAGRPRLAGLAAAPQGEAAT
jgi:hypothetical protein